MFNFRLFFFLFESMRAKTFALSVLSLLFFPTKIYLNLFNFFDCLSPLLTSSRCPIDSRGFTRQIYVKITLSGQLIVDD
jgi:hypothetical protein